MLTLLFLLISHVHELTEKAHFFTYASLIAIRRRYISVITDDYYKCRLLSEPDGDTKKLHSSAESISVFYYSSPDVTRWRERELRYFNPTSSFA